MGDPLLTPGSLGWCRGAVGPGPRRSAGWDQPCAPAASPRSRCAPLGRLHAGARALPVPGQGRPVGGGDGAGRRRDPSGRRGTAGWSAPACTPATTALGGGGGRGADAWDWLTGFPSPVHQPCEQSRSRRCFFHFPFSSLAGLGISKSLVTVGGCSEHCWQEGKQNSPCARTSRSRISYGMSRVNQYPAHNQLHRRPCVQDLAGRSQKVAHEFPTCTRLNMGCVRFGFGWSKGKDISRQLWNYL